MLYFNTGFYFNNYKVFLPEIITYSSASTNPPRVIVNATKPFWTFFLYIFFENPLYGLYYSGTCKSYRGRPSTITFFFYKIDFKILTKFVKIMNIDAGTQPYNIIITCLYYKLYFQVVGILSLWR